MGVGSRSSRLISWQVRTFKLVGQTAFNSTLRLHLEANKRRHAFLQVAHAIQRHAILLGA